jgi:K+-sensing histidine kinase KdpD
LKKWIYKPLSICRPEVVIVDELAHTNIEENEKRWQDVLRF